MLTFYHGGNRGLKVGGFLLPPSKTKKLCTADFVDTKNLYSREVVYVTSDWSSACLFASVHETPTVYVVAPQGELRSDPDCDCYGLAFSCPSAKIVSILKVPGKVIKNCRQLLTMGPNQRTF